MTLTLARSTVANRQSRPDATYQPGACNIGPAEIARRRQAALAGLILTIVLFALLVALSASPLVRFLIAIPAAGTTIAYLQVRLKFCVAFGSRGVFNFGELGEQRQVQDPAARRRDRARVARMVGGGLLIGLIVGLAAAVIPL